MLPFPSPLSGANPSPRPKAPFHFPHGVNCWEQCLFHGGLGETALSGVDVARSKRPRPKAEHSPYRWQAAVALQARSFLSLEPEFLPGTSR